MSEPPVELWLPFDGRWLTVRTPAHRVPSHGTHLGGQTFAYDFVAVGPGRRTASSRDWRTWLATEPVDRFVGFGRPILAPARARVLAVHDGEVDHEARRSPLTLLGYAASQGRRLRRGIAAVTGNHVVLALEARPAFVLLAHLRQGSVLVSPGARLDVGDPVARCGNSGNSTQPHLHLQAMDSPTLLGSRGLPVMFHDYRASSTRAAGTRDVLRGAPGRLEVVESRRRP
jgi:murein DD-endopeptidase MepM/ murein hydrolase activator NlpD